MIRLNLPAATLLASAMLLLPAQKAWADHEIEVGQEGGADYILGVRDGYSKQFGFLRDYPIAYVLHPGELDFTVESLKMNDTVDLFDVRGEFEDDEDLGGVLNTDGAVGDLSGGRLLFNFGISRNLSLLWELGKTNLHYGDGDVELDNQRMSLRYVLSRESRFSPQTSVELSYRKLEGSEFVLKLKELEVRDLSGLVDLNDLANPDDDGNALPVTGVKVVFEDEQELTFGGLTSEEWRVRLLLGKQFSAYSFWHLYFGYEAADVDAELRFNLPVLEEFRDLVKRRQSETQIGIGVNWAPAPNTMVVGFFEGLLVSREEDIKNASGTNRSTRLELLYRYDRNWIVGLNLSVYSNFYIGEAPFLVNQNTASLFDKPYGHVGLGLTIPFNTKKDRRFRN